MEKGENGNRDFAWGEGHLLQCDDVLLCCTLETYGFVKQCHINNFFFKKQEGLSNYSTACTLESTF